MLRENQQNKKGERKQSLIQRGSFRVLGDQGWISFTLMIQDGDAPPQELPRVCLPPLGGNLTPK